MALRIVVPVDGSEAAQGSLAWAIAFAARTGAQIFVCSVFDPMLSCVAAAAGALIDPRPLLEELEADAGTFCSAAVAQSVAANVRATSAVLEGNAAVAIGDFAHAHAADMIVLGTHGRHGLALGILGSVTADVVRSTDVAVVTVRPGTSTSGGGPIVVAVDDSPAAAAAATFAVRLASVLRSSLHLVHVAEDGNSAIALAFDRVSRAAAAAGVTYTAQTRHGPVLENLIAAGAECRALLLATGTHGRGALGRLFLGSVAEGLIREATGAVLVVRR